LEFQKQDDDDLKFLANYVYEKIFLHYTTKQWGVSPEGVDGAVTARVPVYLSKDNRYFQDKYQGIPLEGYTKVVEKMLDHKNIKLKLKTSYEDVKSNDFKRIFYTGSIDEFFDYKYGQLPYRSVRFKLETHNKEYYQSNACVNYPCNYDFTRIHEYKYYLDDKSKKTVIAKEYSESFELGKNERYYPIPHSENTELYERYKKDAENLDNVYFLGRLGDYRYYDMDKAILRAIELFEEVVK
jgi:UDP-galactopyranose mutase